MSHTLHNTFVPLTDRAFFKLIGPDCARFLNGQITQDVSLATHEQAVLTCVTNAKGKLQGIAFVRAFQDGYLIDCPLSLREDLFQRLDMYLIADDAELTDITGEMCMFHQFDTSDTTEGWTSQRYGIPGKDILTRPAGEQASAQDLETMRILHRVPVWGAELNADLLPPEARLEQAAISYSKGCYTGQEVISRIKSSGKVNQYLTAFELSSEITVPAHIPHPENPDGKPAGRITSICFHEEKWIGLGFIHRKYSEQTHFSIATTEVTILP